MRCPHCGHEAEGMARACPNCGYILPFSLRQLHQQQAAEALADPALVTPGSEAEAPAPEAPPLLEPDATTPIAIDNQAADPARASENLGPEEVAHEAAWPQAPQALWPMDPLPSLDWSAPEAAPRHPLGAVMRSPARTGSLVPPSAEETEREGTLPLPSVPTPRGGELLPLPQPRHVPMPAPYPAVPAVVAGAPPLYLAALGPGAFPEGTSQVPVLGSGTLLKRGRYRLLQRFSSAPTFGRRGELEPPLFIASDVQQPTGRVLVQELPIADLPPAQAEQILRRVASRLQLAGPYGMPAFVDAFGERNRWFVVFHLPPGGRLIDRLRHEVALPEGWVIELGLRVLEVLANLENASPPVVHGNISPSNILLQPTGTVVLVGFSPTIMVAGRGLVEHGAAGGSRGYVAPEQLRGQADRRTDLYGLAAVLYYAVTGHDPALRIGPLLQTARHLNPAVSAALDEALAHALRPAPAQRFQSAEEMRAALLPLRPPPPSPPRPRGATMPGPAMGVTASVPAVAGVVGALRETLEHRAVPKVTPQQLRQSPWPRILLIVLVLLGLVGDSVLYVARAHSRPGGVTPSPVLALPALGSPIPDGCHAARPGAALFVQHPSRITRSCVGNAITQELAHEDRGGAALLGVAGSDQL